MILNIWYVKRIVGDRFVLNGDVYGHPRFNDGTNVNTSTIVSLRANDDRICFQTRNSTYECSYADFIGIDFYDELENVVRSLGTETDLSVIQNYFRNKIDFR